MFKVTGHPFWRFVENRYCALKISPIFIKLFYSLKQWPMKMKLKFWKKPISDNDSFELFLFFIGNGGSPHIITEWILTSQAWAEYGKMEKRARQLAFIFNSKEAKINIWFYFDMYHSDWRFLDGTKRQYK
jgi:hypothetical protein